MSEKEKPQRGKHGRPRKKNKPQGGKASGAGNPHAFNSDAAYGSGKSYLPSGHTPADLLPRLAARVIDGLFVGVPALLVYRVLVEGLGGLGAVLGALIYGLTLVAYATILEAGSGQTIGKRMLGLQVLGPNGGFPTKSEAFRRNSFYVLQAVVMLPFWLVQFLALAVLLAVFISIVISIERSPHKQGRHDEVADGTQVVRV
ncbi:RDD family protein [Hoyosella altamirensis]|uniref:Putative RDD family membrane protein YckC n=1 Tax=Hoyosella altamirensis TaxID=616997 RepID=A0A839RP24_9ACTN|nr:RDD family protein [Hoyosella altamirensis]MBB3037884.1 putative RDD family membrane protein YckC [Hoyosella altamirensis]